MISSGIKRGLAATAVSALAVAGIPLLASSAHADSYLDQIGDNDAVLYSQYSTEASVQNDGTNTTVHLLAGGGENVVQVRFEYSATGVAPFTTITTVGRTNGGFSAEWTPPTSIYNLATTVVRAVPLNSIGTDLTAGIDEETVTVGSNTPAVDIANAPGSTVGVFQQPYTEGSQDGDLGVITGKTSDVSDAATVNVSNLTTGVATGTNAATLDAAAAGTRGFAGVVDFDGYVFDTTAPIVNQAVVGAENGSDDAELVNLTTQTITTVTATATPATVQGAGTATGTVTVLDQTGLPVAGAQVFYDADNDNVHDAGEVFQYTDAKGQANFTGLTGSPTGTQHAFIVNTTDADNYDVATDFRRTATVTSYTATATSLAAASKDGDAFDLDEYTVAPGAAGEGDITVTVKDQNGNNLAGQPLTGRWTITAFGATTSTNVTATITDTDADGIYDVALPAGGIEGTYKLDVWKEQDGTPGQSAGDLSAAPLTFKTGEANVTWADGATAQAPAGTTATFKGKIALDDGTVLPNRNVAFAWAPTGNAVVAAQAAQPAGTTRTGDNAATATASATGEFAVAIADPAATPQPAELNGVLTVNSANTPAYGTNTDATDTLDVDFLADSVVDTTQSDTTQANLSGDGATPGRPVRVSIDVENLAGDNLTDLPVTIKTDHGFFTTPTATTLAGLKADPAAADNANYGEWENLGTTSTTATDDNGGASAVVAIERDADFDDDGQVTANVTFTVGGKTFTEPVTFDSSNPLNPGEVKIVLDEDQSVSDATLPNAPTSEVLDWNVQATDQFGNLTDEPVSLSDNGSAADMSATTVTSNFDDQAPALTTFSNEEADQTITGTWVASTLVWNDADDVTAGFQGDTDVADSTTAGTKTVTGASDEIHWYEIDYAASAFSLTHTGSDTQPVGTTVTETYTAVDQNGEPVEGLQVTFYRSGPDDLGDGDGNSVAWTDENGQATYVYQGAKSGVATVTAVVRQDDGEFGAPAGAIIPQGEQTDKVTFKTSQPQPINVKLTGKSQGKKDVLTANANNNGAGAKATLYRVNAKGKQVKITSHVLNTSGNYAFTVSDKNGSKKTKYIVKVAKTAASVADSASTKIK